MYWGKKRVCTGVGRGVVLRWKERLYWVGRGVVLRLDEGAYWDGERVCTEMG